MTQGPAGVKVWLLEVQHFIRQLQRRTFQRMSLCATRISSSSGNDADDRLPQERQAILAFTAYWRQMVSPPVSYRSFTVIRSRSKSTDCQYAMGRPEAQLVLITLTETAQR